jgi:hypothetical protein
VYDHGPIALMGGRRPRLGEQEDDRYASKKAEQALRPTRGLNEAIGFHSRRLHE